MSDPVRPPRHARHTQGSLLLLLVVCIWGSSFAVVKQATDSLHPATLIAWRFTLATLCLLPLLAWRRAEAAPAAPGGRSLWRDGLLLGSWLCVSYGTQTVALQTTSANRAAFITALSVVLVPLWQGLVARQPLPVRLWGAVVLAVAGLGLLSWEGGALVVGDLWALGCALSYAGFILLLDRTARHHEALRFTLAQLLCVTLLGWLWALLAGAPLAAGSGSWGALLYLGLAGTAVATLLQTLGQRWVRAAEASVLYALEPVAATLFSLLLLGERVYLRGLLGGAMVVGATLLSQLGSGHPAAPELHTEEGPDERLEAG